MAGQMAGQMVVLMVDLTVEPLAVQMVDKTVVLTAAKKAEK